MRYILGSFIRKAAQPLAKRYPASLSSILLTRRMVRKIFEEFNNALTAIVLELLHYNKQTKLPFYAKNLKLLKKNPTFYSELANKSYDQVGYSVSDKYLCESERIQTTNRNKIVLDQIGEPVSFFDPGFVSAIGHIPLLLTYPKLEMTNKIRKEHKIVIFNRTANIEYLRSLSELFTFMQIDSEVLEDILMSKSIPLRRMGAVQVGREFLNDYRAQNLAEEEYRNKYGADSHLLDSKLINERISELDNKKIRNLQPGNFVTFHIRNTRTPSNRSANNCELRDYLPAVQYLQKKGMQIVFLGNEKMQRISDFVSDTENIWDYAHDPDKDPLIDLYLLSSAAFAVNTASGPFFVSNDFGVPILYTNQVHIGMNFDLRGFVMPHLVFSKKYNRILCYSEMLDTPLAWNSNEELSDFVRIRNRPEDIFFGVQGMLKNFQEGTKNAWLISREEQKFARATPSMTLEPSFYHRHRSCFTR